jgi:hypothetical protein
MMRAKREGVWCFAAVQQSTTTSASSRCTSCPVSGTFVLRLLCAQLGFNTPALAVNVAVAAVEEGTLLQLHLRDSMWAQQGLRDLVQVSS